MPIKLIQAYATKLKRKESDLEKVWDTAKSKTIKSTSFKDGSPEFYKYTVTIFQRMLGLEDEDIVPAGLHDVADINEKSRKSFEQFLNEASVSVMVQALENMLQPYGVSYSIEGDNIIKFGFYKIVVTKEGYTLHKNDKKVNIFKNLRNIEKIVEDEYVNEASAEVKLGDIITYKNTNYIVTNKDKTEATTYNFVKKDDEINVDGYTTITFNANDLILMSYKTKGFVTFGLKKSAEVKEKSYNEEYYADPSLLSNEIKIIGVK